MAKAGRRDDPSVKDVDEVANDGVKVEAESAWFAARPSGTEDIYKIYAESFRGAEHLRLVLEEAQTIVDDALGGSPGTGKP